MGEVSIYPCVPVSAFFAGIVYLGMFSPLWEVADILSLFLIGLCLETCSDRQVQASPDLRIGKFVELKQTDLKSLEGKK